MEKNVVGTQNSTYNFPLIVLTYQETLAAGYTVDEFLRDLYQIKFKSVMVYKINGA